MSFTRSKRKTKSTFGHAVLIFALNYATAVYLKVSFRILLPNYLLSSIVSHFKGLTTYISKQN